MQYKSTNSCQLIFSNSADSKSSNKRPYKNAHSALQTLDSIQVT